MARREHRILLGRIVGAHGIRGEVVIHAFTAVAADIGAYGPLTSADGTRSFRLSSVRNSSKGVVARIAGVSDRNGAEALKGLDLFVPRARLPAPDDGDYYVADLVGLTVVDGEGQIVGEVVDAPNYGAGALLEIRRTGAAQTELVPFTDACVPEVDIAGRRVVIRPPAFAEGGPDDDAGQ